MSFSSKEKEAAFVVFERLTQAGIKTFFSSESLKKYSGYSFTHVINHALENSQHFILFCTPNAIQSNWVKLEWETFFNVYMENPTNRRFFVLKGHDFHNVTLPLILKRIQYSDNVSGIIAALVKKQQPQSIVETVKVNTVETPPLSKIALPFFQNYKYGIGIISALLIGVFTWLINKPSEILNQPLILPKDTVSRQISQNVNQKISQETTKVTVPIKPKPKPKLDDIQKKKDNEDTDKNEAKKEIKFDYGNETGDFMAMAGAFASKDNARALVRKLQIIGFSNADVINLENSANFNVVAGYYLFKGGADAAVRTMKANHIDGFIRKKSGEIFKAQSDTTQPVREPAAIKPS